MSYALELLKNCRSGMEAISVMEDAGARFLGKGCYATVLKLEYREQPKVNPLFPYSFNDAIRFEVPSERKSTVVKITRGKDAGGLLVVRAAMATAGIDPLAPKYGGLIEFGDGSWAVEMEELQPLPDMHGNAVEHVNITGASYNYRPTDDAIASSPFLKILEAWHDSAPYTYSWDLHSGNIMLRNGRPVVTDPMCA